MADAVTLSAIPMPLLLGRPNTIAQDMLTMPEDNQCEPGLVPTKIIPHPNGVTAK
jgi:hypothetical protein